MNRRFCQIGYLKPEKVEEYRALHANVWEKVQEMITACGLRNYSIHIQGNMVISYFEYIGSDYEGDMHKMEQDPITQEWWTHTKPCFAHHDEQLYYVDMEEIFYQA